MQHWQCLVKSYNLKLISSCGPESTAFNLAIANALLAASLPFAADYKLKGS